MRLAEDIAVLDILSAGRASYIMAPGYRPEEEAISRVRAREMLAMSPLGGGLPPDIAWPYLERVGKVVLPEASGSAEGALGELLSNKKG